ncbi:MAG: ATP-binding protein [Actinomycetota bacterium]
MMVPKLLPRVTGRSVNEASGLKPGDFGLGRLFTLIQEAVIVGDARSGQIVLWNPAAEKLFGYKAEEALNMGIHDLVPKQFRGAHLAGLERYNRIGRGDLVDSGTLVELPGLHKDGTLINLEFALTRLDRTDEAETPFVLATLRDVSFRKEADRLRSEEQDADLGRAKDLLRKTTFITLLQNVAVAANEATDVEEAFQHTLEEICELTGWPVGHAHLVGKEGELIPTDAWYDIDPALTAAFREETMHFYHSNSRDLGLIGQAIATRKPNWITDVTSEEGFLRRKAAKDAGLRAAFAFPLLVGEEVVGVLEFFSSRSMKPDEEMLQVMGPVGVQLGRVVERHRAALGLVHHRDELARSNADLEQFAYVASHDLQEPLRMISSYMQLLSRRYKGKLDSEADEFIDYAVDGASRMQTLIQALLSFSRIGRKGTARERVDISEVVAVTKDNLQVAISESGATILHDELPQVTGDPAQMLQLFQNLIGNALKFRGEDRPVVRISAAMNDDGAWTLSVEDNGIGIDPQYADRIFLLFQRLHARAEYEGTGIGLSVCRKIVEHHGGKIWVDVEHQGGTAMRFTLPAWKEKV